MSTAVSLPISVLIARWTARIIGLLLFLLFLLLFIPDVISKGGLPYTTFGPRMVTTFFVLGQIGYLLAWKWEGFGGVFSAICFILMLLINWLWVHAGHDQGAGALIYLIPSVLFIYSWWRTKSPPETVVTGGLTSDNSAAEDEP